MPIRKSADVPLFYLKLFFIGIYIVNPANNRSGKTVPKRMPFRRLSPKALAANPTTVGPLLHPKSPARARRAKRAVPPRGIEALAILKLPGHMMPTDRPQSPQPSRLSQGIGERAVSRYAIIQSMQLTAINR